MKHILISILLLMPICLSAQFTVKGVIVDQTGEGLPGVSIVEVGKPTNGVFSDVDGAFQLRVASAKSKITISYIGFIAQTLGVSADMKITMEENENMLKEVEIVRQGFGTEYQI